MSVTSMLIILLILFLIKKILVLLNLKINDYYKSEKLYNGFISRKYLSENITENEFEYWCELLLIDMDCKNIYHFSEHKKGGVNIACFCKNNTVYVSTRLYKSLNDSIDDEYEEVDIDEVQIFICNMMKNQISNGIIITTGNFTNEAVKYVNQLPSTYSIKLMDGACVTREFRKIKTQELSNLIQSKSM